jgi:hypothetical protein
MFAANGTLYGPIVRQFPLYGGRGSARRGDAKTPQFGGRSCCIFATFIKPSMLMFDTVRSA